VNLQGSRLSLDPSCEVIHCNTPVSLGDPKRWNIAVSEQAIKRGSTHFKVFAHFRRRQHPRGVAKEKVMFGRSAEAAKRFCFAILGAIRMCVSFITQFLCTISRWAGKTSDCNPSDGCYARR
jgi:hypothetical protein